MTDTAGSEVVDLVFELAGRAVMADYADRLLREIGAVLPWLADDDLAGILPLWGVSTGQEGELYLSRRSRLTLRLAADRVEAARALCGATLELGDSVQVGAAKVRELQVAKVLYSPFVQVDLADEAAFLAECGRRLEQLAVDAEIIAGRPQRMTVAGSPRHGFSLMLHSLRDNDSLRMQRLGLGEDRKRGCGVFVPHKNIAAVGEK